MIHQHRGRGRGGHQPLVHNRVNPLRAALVSEVSRLLTIPELRSVGTVEPLMRRLQADNPYWQVSGEMIISVLQDIKKGKGHGGGGNGSGTAHPPPPPSSPTGTKIRNQQQQQLQQPQHQGYSRPPIPPLYSSYPPQQVQVQAPQVVQVPTFSRYSPPLSSPKGPYDPPPLSLNPTYPQSALSNTSQSSSSSSNPFNVGGGRGGPPTSDPRSTGRLQQHQQQQYTLSNNGRYDASFLLPPQQPTPTMLHSSPVKGRGGAHSSYRTVPTSSSFPAAHRSGGGRTDGRVGHQRGGATSRGGRGGGGGGRQQPASSTHAPDHGSGKRGLEGSGNGPQQEASNKRPNKRPHVNAKKEKELQPEQVELLLPILRSTYCHAFSSLSQDHLPPLLPCPLDLRHGLPLEEDPISYGLTAATRDLFRTKGYLAILVDLNEIVEIGPQGDISVKTQVIKTLWRLFYKKEAMVRCSIKIQGIICNAVNVVVQSSATAVIRSDISQFVHLLLTTPWDVISLYRRTILERLTSLVEMVEKRQYAQSFEELHTLVRQLAQPQKGLWDPRSEEEMRRLLARLDALAVPSCPGTPSLPPFPPRFADGGSSSGQLLPPAPMEFSPSSPLLHEEVSRDESLIISPPQSPTRRSPSMESGIASLGLHGRGGGGSGSCSSANKSTNTSSSNDSNPTSSTTTTASGPATLLQRVVAGRDPRIAAREKAARKVRPLKVEFTLLPDDPDRYIPTTYMKSHSLGDPLVGRSTQPPCLHCQAIDWVKRCTKCSRCQLCAKTIFCKGAERKIQEVGHGHINRLSDRMDRAIWDAFRSQEFDPLLALIKYTGVSVNFKRASKGETALMAAAYRGNYAVAEELLNMGADPSLKTDDGMTAWTFASKYDHQKVADLIVRHLRGEVKAEGGIATTPKKEDEKKLPVG